MVRSILGVMMSRFILGLGLMGFIQMGLGSVSHAQENVDAQRKMAEEDENKAFGHIKNEEWCKATNAFLDAYESVPQVVYIYNAAKAAEYAKDRKLALQLSLEMMGKFPSSDKQAEINALIQKLSSEITSVGTGIACPRTKKEAPAQATLPATPTPSTPAAPESAAAPAATTPPGPLQTEPKGLLAPAHGGIYTGVGLALVGSGSILMGLGGLSYANLQTLSAAHASLKQEVEADPSDVTKSTELFDLQNQFNEESNSYQTFLYSGLGVTAMGAVITGLGIYLQNQQPQSE
jgi:hypothetical protein